jgi:aerobic carbon-monoxide dehydrogenase small subunit
MPLQVSFTLNGQPAQLQVDDRTLLVDMIRDELGQTGTHVGCETSQCGACTVLVDGAPVKSCTVLAGQAEGMKVTTVEGLSEPGGPLHPMQAAFSLHHAVQCGFCTPGMIMASVALLQRNPDPTDEEIVEGIDGNICRCTGYLNIIKAVRACAAARGA